MSEHQKEDCLLADRMRAAYHANRQVYGSPRVHAELQADGVRCSRKRIARLMREQGLSFGSQATSSNDHDAEPTWSTGGPQYCGT